MSSEGWVAPPGENGRMLLLRVVCVATVVLGLNYVGWRWLFSLNWDAWWIAVPLVVAETYSLIDVILFSITMWRSRFRPRPPRPVDGLTVDVFITSYDEPIALVMETARAAKRIRYPHRTWVLDDGRRGEMRAAADAAGVGYITRSPEWDDRPLHAKAGNLNNALLETDGEFILILDADQVPRPDILDATLGYFADDRVALVQTPQVFGNVATGDPLGSQAPLFYGPIQRGKDGWNAAFFCGSNAILRREALMQLGIRGYVEEVERAVLTALAGGRRVIRKAAKELDPDNHVLRVALDDVAAAVETARARVAAGDPLSTITYELQQRITEISRGLVAIDMHLLAMDLAAIKEIEEHRDDSWDAMVEMGSTVHDLALRELSPLGALESVQTMLRSIDVDRFDEAQPLMPLATISVTEDMATSMRMHAMGWKSVFHEEVLAIGLAPEDIGSMLKQRLRWAQGTMQVMLRENPLFIRGLDLAQRLMYFATMWSYLSGYAAIVYFAAPIVFLCFGVLPVDSSALEFFLRFIPFMIVNQLLFAVAGRGISTWRGQQYSLALFPVWIKATTSAFANVVFHKPLGFVVTAKTRQDGKPSIRLILPQLIAAILLVVASVIGTVRLVLGIGEPVGTAVNLFWVVFDLVILSVLVPAMRYRGFRTEVVVTER